MVMSVEYDGIMVHTKQRRYLLICKKKYYISCLV